MPAEGFGRSNVFREQPGVFKPGGHDGRTGKGTVEGWKGGRCIECIGIRVQERNDDLGNLTSVAVSACPGSFLPSALVLLSIQKSGFAVQKLLHWEDFPSVVTHSHVTSSFISVMPGQSVPCWFQETLQRTLSARLEFPFLSQRVKGN